jgi:hypothetical protein
VAVPAEQVIEEASEMRRRTLGALVGVGLLVGMWPNPAGAHDHRPPRAFMLTGSERQRAERGGYSWAQRQGAFCSLIVADVGELQFPDAAAYKIGDRIRFRFRKEQRPKEVEIDQYRDVKRNGTPKGDAHEKPFRLARVLVDGNVRWEARFEVNRAGHHYFHVTAAWKDVDRCGPQKAEWTAHLKAGQG